MNNKRDFSALMPFIKDKRVIVYGTGVIAEDLITSCTLCDYVAVLDGFKLEGSFCGIPITDFEDIKKGSIDCIVIAATQFHLEEIYNRIYHWIDKLRLSVYDINGNNLFARYSKVGASIDDRRYMHKTLIDLTEKLDDYDVISFDVFDTLVVRRTMNPSDVFRLLEIQLSKEGIKLDHFASARRMADRESKGGDIYEIYRILQKRYSLSDDTREYILKKEMDLEFTLLTVRKDMLKAFNHALKLNKKVCLISDMYMPSDIMGDILKRLGITGYDKLYVSCEYECGKGSGLYNKYLEDDWGDRRLHIGDNPYVDGKMPRECGIDSFLIKSAWDLFCISSLYEAFHEVWTIGDRLWLGYIISELFNSPFSLYRSSGMVMIGTPEIFATGFSSAIAIIFMEGLKRKAYSEKYKYILFGARDMHFFYDLWIDEKIKLQSKYVLVSRKATVSAGVTEKTWEELKKTLLEYEYDRIRQLYDLFGIFVDNGEMDYDYSLVLEKNKNDIMGASEIKRNNMKKYFEREGVSENEKYLFCDLSSNGTVHYFLQTILSSDIDGFYLFKGQFVDRRELNVSYIDSDHGLTADIVLLLENIFSSSEASLRCFDSSGTPVYEEETRSEDEIRTMRRIHNKMHQDVLFFNRFSCEDIEISLAFAYYLLKSFDRVILTDDMRGYGQQHLDDPMTMKRWNIDIMRDLQ